MTINIDITDSLEIAKLFLITSIENLLISLDNEKKWILEERNFPGGGFIKNNHSYKCSITRLLLATGVAMANVSSSNNIEAWYAILRHANSFSKNKELFFKEKLDTLDWRKKAIYSEEVGIGSSICILGDKYNVRFIADVSFFLEKIINNKNNPYYNLGLNSRDIYGEDGKYSPDFFCLTNSRRAVVAESKGTMGFYSRLEKPLEKGKKQVKNVTPRGVSLRSNASRLVFATQIPVENINTRSKPHTVILDPEEEDSIFIDVSNEEIIRQSLAKTLSFMNYNRQAVNLVNKKSISDWIRNLKSETIIINNQKFHSIRYIGSGWHYVYTDVIFKILREYSNRNILKGLEKMNFFKKEVDNDIKCKNKYDLENIKILPMGFGLVRV